MSDGSRGPERNALALVGIVLVVIGLAAAANQTGLVPPFAFRYWDRLWDARWGLLVIVLGVLVLVAGAKPGGAGIKMPPKGTRLYRSKRDQKLGGVLGGLGAYLSVDPTILRIAFVALVLMNAPGIVLAYIIMWIIVPEEPDVPVPPARPEAPPPPPADTEGQ